MKSLFPRVKNELILSIITLTFVLASHTLESSAHSRKHKQKLKYILQWETYNKEPLILGRQTFIDRKCDHTNCYILSTNNGMPKDVDYTKYDAILFGPDLTNISMHSLPKRRSPHQKYVFISSEASDTYPLKVKLFDGYFNWTWTYRLDSDLIWGLPFVVVTDMPMLDNKRVVAPKINTEWVNEWNMPPIQPKVLKTISNKKRAVAWYVSNCNTTSGREKQADELGNILRSRYGLHLDIYGKCGQNTCSKDMGEVCDEFIRNNYFFYLAYEKSLSEDYVSDQLLHAVKHYTVPVVYGGAHYSRFLPENSYINAMQISISVLAKKINAAVRDPSIYQNYLKWNFFYAYQRTDKSPDTDDYCRMCALLNDKKKVQQKTTHEYFTSWWTVQREKPVIERQRSQPVASSPPREVTVYKTIPILHPVVSDIDDSWFVTLYKDMKWTAKEKATAGMIKALNLKNRVLRALKIKRKKT